MHSAQARHSRRYGQIHIPEYKCRRRHVRSVHRRINGKWQGRNGKGIGALSQVKGLLKVPLPMFKLRMRGCFQTVACSKAPQGRKGFRNCGSVLGSCRSLFRRCLSPLPLVGTMPPKRLESDSLPGDVATWSMQNVKGWLEAVLHKKYPQQQFEELGTSVCRHLIDGFAPVPMPSYPCLRQCLRARLYLRVRLCLRLSAFSLAPVSVALRISMHLLFVFVLAHLHIPPPPDHMDDVTAIQLSNLPPKKLGALWNRPKARVRAVCNVQLGTACTAFPEVPQVYSSTFEYLGQGLGWQNLSFSHKNTQGDPAGSHAPSVHSKKRR